ncbi:MAG: type II toxin-antitoxin system HipA family toxin [Endomicrobium sp.]|jgi:serine/threonine-protein kinase HipA|nr:type II toxin-antitoxin system HipA family toxin [Endomicrobium sp.]
MENKILSVRLFGQEVGTLKQDEIGKMRFAYSNNAQTAISMSLPLEKKNFNEKECRPYFNGLLPENETTRERLAKIFKISSGSDFALLRAIGHDCAGALSLHNPDEPEKKVSFMKLDCEAKTEEELAKYIEELPERPLFIGEDNDIRLSLAGVQDKATVSVLGGEICFPKNGALSTHILKPLVKKFDNTVSNEYLCMRLTSALGIRVPKVEIRKAKDIPYFLIERYDREVKGDEIKRIHQEDFCQALGILSGDKYQKDGGPGIKECFDLLDKTVVPAKDRVGFMKIIMFNYLIGNNDAHGKNFALLYKNESYKPVFAPAYDILSTEVYPELSKKMAMRIGSSYEKELTTAFDWQKMCNSVSYSFTEFKREFLGMCQTLPEKLDAEIKSLRRQSGNDIHGKISEVVLKNIKQIKEVLD